MIEKMEAEEIKNYLRYEKIEIMVWYGYHKM